MSYDPIIWNNEPSAVAARKKKRRKNKEAILRMNKDKAKRRAVAAGED